MTPCKLPCKYHASYYAADIDTKKLFRFCAIPRSRSEIQEIMKLTNRDYFEKKCPNL